jgi:ATP-binding cassette subfamily F protein uup
VNLVNLEKAAKAYGPRVLLDAVSLGVSAGMRVGVIGRNGSGKSTLLSILAGVAEPDSGRVTQTGGLRLSHLLQRDELSGSVREIVLGSVPEHVWAADSRARGVLSALLPGISLDAQADRLSGGERRRVALAASLAWERDLLLLDEPTNHLDIDAIDWLGRHLRDRGCAVVVATHDRWFLDTVSERTWELAGGKVHSYEGGYSAYVLAKAERARSAEAAEQRRRSLLRKELAWLRRGPSARTSKPRFRVQAANALIAGEPVARDGVELTRLATARLGKTVIDVEDASLRIDQRPLLDRVTWHIGPGERVGVLGVNGSGKTSLLRLLSGDGAAGIRAEGRVVRGATVRLGHLTQELDELDPAKRVREAVEEVRLLIRVGKRELSASQLLERLGFSGDRQWTPVGELSGGERRRLQLLRLLMDEPNVLLLDEPTNDLDIEVLTELEDLLDGWPGSLVVVSHDRYFLERVTDHVVALLGDGKLSFLGGGVDEYLERLHGGLPARDARGTANAGTGAAGALEGRKGQSTVAEPPSSGARERAARKELQRLERRLDGLTSRETELAVTMAGCASDYARLTKLGAELRAVEEEKAGLEERWLVLAEEFSA